MESKKLRVGEAAKILGVTVQTLRNWDKNGKLRAHRTEGGQRYYERLEVQRFMLNLTSLAWAWAASAQPPEISDDYYCERQDRFTSRVEKMGVTMLRVLGDEHEETVSLLGLVAGEIGDNSFAHNVGNWPDVPGVFFTYDLDKRLIVLADRGRGVLTTLRQVRPKLADDSEALHVAFTEIVSGRDPEKRGNGLKVVRRVSESNEIGLFFRSGLGLVEIPRSPGAMSISATDENVRGVYTVITY